MSTSSFELFWVVTALLLLCYGIFDTRKQGKLSQHLLFFICGGTLFWQEFYADWGAFLVWNESFHMMPWGKTLWSIEQKPWFNIAAYPVFMWAAFTSISMLFKAFNVSESPKKLALICITVAGPTLYCFNVVTEYIAVAQAGLWTYTETIGPALRTDAGTMPLVYPGVPFALFAVLLSFLLHYKDPVGKPVIETHFFKDGLDASPVKKIMFWAVVWNCCYWLALCTPLITIRTVFSS